MVSSKGALTWSVGADEVFVEGALWFRSGLSVGFGSGRRTGWSRGPAARRPVAWVLDGQPETHRGGNSHTEAEAQTATGATTVHATGMNEPGFRFPEILRAAARR